jgi:hypothetical protein
MDLDPTKDLGGYSHAEPKAWALKSPTRRGEIGEGRYQLPSGRGLEQKVAMVVLACIAGTMVYL